MYQFKVISRVLVYLLFLTKGVGMFRLLFLVLFLCTSISARLLYVAPTGNDAVAITANTITTPWATPKKAWETAIAGDTVYFRAGTYSITTQIWTKFVGGTGTVTSPIVFSSYPNETATISAATTLDPVIIIEKNWNIIRNLTFVGGKSFFMFGYDFQVNGGLVENCISSGYLGGDNVGFVYVGGAANITIRNCTITGPGLGSQGVHLNTAGIIAFNAAGLKILNCSISNAPIGIYYKHGITPTTQSGIEIAYNFIRKTDRFSMELNCNYAYVHDNLIGDSCSLFQINESNGGPGGDYNTFSHNTFYSSNVWLSSDASGALYNTFFGNVFNKGIKYLPDPAYFPHYSVSDSNVYPIGTTAIQEFAASYSLASWKTYSGKDINSFIGAPIFLNASPTLTIADYALAPSSPGYSTVRKSAGADIALVGYKSGTVVPPVVPPVPSIADSQQIFIDIGGKQDTLTVPRLSSIGQSIIFTINGKKDTLLVTGLKDTIFTKDTVTLVLKASTLYNIKPVITNTFKILP
jgi:hypothetical protein